MDVLVTVGMSPWRFDRLVSAAALLAGEHAVFVQTGTAAVEPACPSAPYLPYQALLERITAADVVVTHAGNTVRLVQRAGKVPIAVAREAARREMSNDHQVEFLLREQAVGRVVPVWDVARLPAAVREHPARERELLGTRPLSPIAEPQWLGDTVDAVCARLTRQRPRRATRAFGVPGIHR